jgi:glutaredoxin
MDAKKLMEQSRTMFRRAIEPLGHKSSPDENAGDSSQQQEAKLEKEASVDKVVIYALSTCPWCKKARKFFLEKNIVVEYLEYDKVDEETRQSIKENCSHFMEELVFPIVKAGDDVVVGYDPKKYSSLLDK